MYIHGFYYNQHGEKISVYILTRGDRSQEVEIGGEGSDIAFTDDPVELTSQVNDTFDHLLCQQASVRLLCKNYEPGFFCNSCRDAVVNIYRGDDCLFAGYIEPQAFSQGYNEAEDEVELTCIDALSALQYSRYRNIGALGVSYRTVKSEAKQRTFMEIMEELLDGVMSGLDLVGGHTVSLLYDGSKAVDSQTDHRFTVFDDISISELLFLGSEEDDVWTQEDVLTEILRYLNLHLRQEGFRLWLFAWETIRANDATAWSDQYSDGIVVTTPRQIDIETSIVSDCNTQISLSETYNQLLLTDSVEEMESVVESPLDSDSLQNGFDGKQKYLTEYSADGEGKTAWRAIRDMVKGRASDFGDASITDWYVQVRKCASWKFYRPGCIDIVEEYCTGQHQERLPDYLGKVTGAAALLSVGKVKKDNGGNDNSPISRVDMTDYLVISVNGNGKDGEQTCQPSESAIKAAIPCAEYIGNEAGGVFSPNDEQTTNYIVVSGQMVMNPLMPMTDNYTTLRSRLPDKDDYSPYWHQTVASRHNDDGRYYTRQHWQSASWRDEPTWNSQPDQEGNPCFIPFTGEGPQEYEFKYSGVGDTTDNLSKVGVVQCMLIIGDKCVVEKQPGEDLGTGVKGTGNGQLSDFVWRPYKERSQCASDDEYYQQSFTIGFDPKIGDKIIGTEFSIQNNLSYTQGVDAEGIAIPIRKSDKVHGQVRFLILGPVNNIWNEVTRRHPSFWHHTKWGQNAVPLLAHTSCILIKQLEVKVLSDNGKMGSSGGSGMDIIYMSDTQEDFVNRKDDLEMKITTALTSEECRQLGVNNTANLSSPLNVVTDDSLLSLYSYATQESAKPEQHYVNDYWQEWHEPRVVMKQSMDDGETVSYLSHYRHPAMGKVFHVVGIDRNLTEGTARMTMKELF